MASGEWRVASGEWLVVSGEGRCEGVERQPCIRSTASNAVARIGFSSFFGEFMSRDSIFLGDNLSITLCWVVQLQKMGLRGSL